MKKLSTIKIAKLRDNGIKRMPIDVNARQVKVARNTAKKYLRMYNLLGSSHQAHDAHWTSSHPSGINQRHAASVHYDTSSPDQSFSMLLAELQRSREENSDLTDLSVKVVNELGNLEGEFERSKQSNTDLTTTNQELIKKDTELEQFIETQKEQHKRELEEQKTRHDQEIDTLNRQHRCDLDEQKNKATTLQQDMTNQQKRIEDLTDNYNSSIKTNETLTEKLEQTRSDKKRLEEKHSNDWLKYTVVGVGGFGAGIVIDRYILPRLLDLIFPQSVEHGKNTYTMKSIIPIKSDDLVQSAITHIQSGVVRNINISGTLCSGPFYDTYGETHGTGYDATPNQQEGVIQPGFPSVVNMATYTSGSQCSGFFCSSHLETGFAPQDAPPVQVPSSFQTPLNYYYFSLPSPLPDDLSEVYPMKQLRELPGIPFEIFIEKLLIHRGCPTQRTPPTHDKGTDLIVTLDWKKTVIQCKQRPKVRIDTIQRTVAAKIHHEADRAIVITTGTFTQDAIDEAKLLGVECWDGERLLREIYKDQFFDLPE